jgi:hypothetical protein
MRVGELEGELEEPLFCKRSLYRISVGREGSLGRKEVKGGESRDSVAVRACTHCKHAFRLIEDQFFLPMSFLSVHVLYECYLCVYLCCRCMIGFHLQG